MIKKIHCAFIASLYALGVTSVCAATPNDENNANFAPMQTKQIETVVHDYLVGNPKVIIEAMQNLQKQEAQKNISEIKTQIPKYVDEIFNTKASGRAIVGTDKPDVIIAEFFSYQCPNCRMMYPTIEKLINTHKNLQLVLIGWTFEGEDDIYAAQTDLAAQKQGKYFELYKAIMQTPGMLTKETIDKAAISTGLDMNKLHTDMEDDAINKSLQDNFKLAKELKLVGTPTFIITNSTFSKFNVVFGKTDEQELQKAINEVRS